MNISHDELRATIARQAGDWLLAIRGGELDAAGQQAFLAWLRTSPLHIQEYLGLRLLARDLRAAADDPALPADLLMERARTANDDNVAPLPSNAAQPIRPRSSPWAGGRWRLAAAVMATAIMGALLLWLHPSSPTSQRFATRHGEQQAWRLADNSVLRLNTDTALTVRYGRNLRRIEIEQGEALFEVARDPGRPFQVVAGNALVTATGTRFDVYRRHESTLVTVIQGQVTVATTIAVRAVPLHAGEEVPVAGDVVGTPAPADVQRNTAWLWRQIVFTHQPLATVAAEFNRYGALPIEIETPALRALTISGVFKADDTETFIDFLRTLNGVTVETTPSAIRVRGRSAPTPVTPEHALTSPPRT